MSDPLTLHDAACSHNLLLLEQLLDDGADPNARDEFGRSALLVALRPNDVPATGVVRLLLERGADPNLPDQLGNAALHNLPSVPGRFGPSLDELAEQIVAIADVLLEHGANLTMLNTAGCTPLDVAPSGPLRTAAEWLLSHGAECSPHSACRLSLVSRVEAALASDPSFVSAEVDWNQPLHEAAWGLAYDVVELLLASGAAADARGCCESTPLHFAAANCGDRKLDVIELLLDHGADPNAEDRDGMTPVDMAMQYCLSVAEPPPPFPRDVCDVLIAHGASRWGVHAAAGPGQLERVRDRVDGGTSPDLAGPAGRTPLFYAVDARRLDVVELLLARGATVDVHDHHDGSTPLHLAVRNDDAVATAALLQRGADVFALNYAIRTPLDLAPRGTVVGDLLRQYGGEWWDEMEDSLGGVDGTPPGDGPPGGRDGE